MKKKPLAMNEVGLIPSRSKGREYVVQNAGSGVQYDTVSLDKGDDIVLESSGATIYDEKIANEVRDKYKNDPNITVIEKNHIKLNRNGRANWSWLIKKCNAPGCFAKPYMNTDYCVEHKEKRWD
jgi:hypothetical protein